MIRRPPRSTRKESSAASDVYKRQEEGRPHLLYVVMRHASAREHDERECGALMGVVVGFCQHEDHVDDGDEFLHNPLVRHDLQPDLLIGSVLCELTQLDQGVVSQARIL